MSMIDMIPYIQNSPLSEILNTFEIVLHSFEATSSLSTEVNKIETHKKANDASISSYEIDQSEFLADKMFKKAKFNRLKIIILKSITKDIEVLIEDFIIKDLLQTIKEIKTKSISVQPILLFMCSSEANLIPAKNQLLLKMFVITMMK